MQLRLPLFVLLLVLSNSCVEPYDSKVKKGGARIVVEGWLIDKPGPYTIRLSKTSNYSFGYEGVNFGVKGAKVFLSDDLGNRAEYKEVKYGRYETDKAAITGTVGRTYQLTIQIGNKVFQSKPQKMIEVAPIDSLYYQYKEENEFREEGFYIYAQTKHPADGKNYYWWEWEGYTPRDFCTYNFPETPGVFACCTPCWDIDRDSTKLYFNSDYGINGNFIKDQEVARIPYYSRFMVEVKVTQYALSEEAYHYFSKIKLLQESSGSVFSVAPFEVKGNLINVDDDDDALLGHFTVASRKWKWISVDRSNVNKLPSKPPAVSGPKAPGCAPCYETDVTTGVKPGQ